MGRSPKEKYKNIHEKLDRYISKTNIPIFAEFCYTNDLCREYMYELAQKNEILSYTIKKCSLKKEAQLERLGLQGEIDRGIAIFSLKQLGWRDERELSFKESPEIKINVIPNTRPV